MRKSVRAVVATALAVPMTLGFAGAAFAHGDHGDHGHPGDKNQGAFSQSIIGQKSETKQESTNVNVAPVTQINPAVNVPVLNLLGGGGAIEQDNSVDSSNLQGNAAETNQSADSSSEAGNQG
ncbi:hypothetical protein [Pseudonocardia phyllosphaerae]|uniref:hypothetical protein n=1 Tax=Pseudonocardia phyllosphaerae TaxID=3390502 RepID=UPI00397CC8C0